MSFFYVDYNIETRFRYDLTKFLEYKEGIYDTYNSYFLSKFCKLPEAGAYLISTVPERPDIYSRDLYATTDYWHLLLEFNNILFLNELQLGKSLRYFNLSDLEDLFFTIKTAST